MIHTKPDINFHRHKMINLFTLIPGITLALFAAKDHIYNVILT